MQKTFSVFLRYKEFLGRSYWNVPDSQILCCKYYRLILNTNYISATAYYFIHSLALNIIIYDYVYYHYVSQPLNQSLMCVRRNGWIEEWVLTLANILTDIYIAIKTHWNLFTSRFGSEMIIGFAQNGSKEIGVSRRTKMHQGHNRKE